VKASHIQFAKLVAVTALLFCSRPGIAQQTSCKPDYFTVLDFANEPSVWSPDLSKRIRLLKDLTIRVEANGKDVGAIKLPYEDDEPVNTFIKWSDDSGAFYVLIGSNAIDGQTIAYEMLGDELRELQAPKAVAQEFAKHHSCQTRGNNLYAIRWEQNSHQLLLMAEVYPTSDCGREMGFSEGYVAEAATGKILKRYTSTQIEAMLRECWPDKLLDGADNNTPRKAKDK
jgi:hypothetical protein